MNPESTRLSIQEYCDKVDAAVRSGLLSSEAAKNVKRWLTEPQYHEYAARLAELVDAEDYKSLEAMFWTVIPFGTGGRRGIMGEMGCATVNRRTIAESAHGLAEHLKQTKPRGGRAVIAHDSRNRSPEFARVTATTLAAHGLKVFLFDAVRSTPELSFAVRYLQCDVGVVISASHNPPSDNGFKAYWNTGGQVLYPDDEGIINCVDAAGEIPAVDFDQAVQAGQIEFVSDAVDRPYVDAVVRLSLSAEREFSALYTPLHGVGETSVYRVLQQAGFRGVDVFELQREPDGDFPNVPDHFPNPERAEVFQPAIKHAKQAGHEMVLASDPDADRLAVAVRRNDGEFVCLTGNQLGALVADYILDKLSAAGLLTPEHYVVETLVTTPMLAPIAQSYGVRIINDLLVGFKYIGQTMDVEGADKFVFGMEESLGYLAGEYCRDKDAAIAALYALELAAELKKQGKTLLDRLDELYVEHGYFAETQKSVVCKGAQGQEQIQKLISALRNSPPIEFAGHSFVHVRDYGQHEIRGLPDNVKIEDIPKPEGELLIFESRTPDGFQAFAARPSGTEPKIKFYLFAGRDCEALGQLADIKSETSLAQSEFSDALSEWIDRTLEEG